MLGRRLKILRKEANITQEDLGKNVGVTTSMIGMYETNARKPSYEVLLKLSEYFNVSTDYLLGNTNFKYYEDEEIEKIEELLELIVRSKRDDIRILSRDLLELIHLTTRDAISSNKLIELTFLKDFYYITYTLQNTLSNNAYNKFIDKNESKILTDNQIADMLENIKLKFNNLATNFNDYYSNKEMWINDMDVDLDDLFSLFDNSIVENEIEIIAAHHDGKEFTEDELESIEMFKEVIRKKKENNK